MRLAVAGEMEGKGANPRKHNQLRTTDIRTEWCSTWDTRASSSAGEAQWKPRAMVESIALVGTVCTPTGRWLAGSPGCSSVDCMV